MNKLYVQYGCGLCAPEQWKNFDASPTLRIQKNPVLSTILKSRLSVRFPDNVNYGDIVKGLPVADNSCDGVYCSHTLEHLALSDFRTALKNTYKILKPGGIFRCVVPDIEFIARQYLKSLEEGNVSASHTFMNESMLGLKERGRGLKSMLVSSMGNSDHLWMWDHASLAEELKKAGFKNVRRCKFDDSKDTMFKYVEAEHRFENAAALECEK